MATASSIALISKSGQIMSTMVIGVRTSARAKVTAITTMRIFTWASGRSINATVKVRSSLASRTATRAHGKMICAMGEALSLPRMELSILESSIRTKSMGTER